MADPGMTNEEWTLNNYAYGEVFAIGQKVKIVNTLDPIWGDTKFQIQDKSITVNKNDKGKITDIDMRLIIVKLDESCEKLLGSLRSSAEYEPKMRKATRDWSTLALRERAEAAGATAKELDVAEAAGATAKELGAEAAPSNEALISLILEYEAHVVKVGSIVPWKYSARDRGVGSGGSSGTLMAIAYGGSRYRRKTHKRRKPRKPRKPRKSRKPRRIKKKTKKSRRSYIKKTHKNKSRNRQRIDKE